jgi:hypothetical protein
MVALGLILFFFISGKSNIKVEISTLGLEMGESLIKQKYLKNVTLKFFFYYSYVHTMLGSFLPPAPPRSLTTHPIPSLSPPLPRYPAETIFV